jgi:sugar phosphate permease
LGFAAYFIGALTFTTPAATAARTIGWKYNIIFVISNVILIVLIYYFIPETSGKSLEEIGKA